MEVLSKDMLTAFENSTHCHVCSTKFLQGETKVKDHKKYRGPAHNSCNLTYRDYLHIPVFFHTLSGYDSHLML